MRADDRLNSSAEGIETRTLNSSANLCRLCIALRQFTLRRTDRPNEYLEVLSAETGISVNGLIDTKVGTTTDQLSESR